MAYAGVRARRNRRIGRPDFDGGYDWKNVGGIYPPFPTTPVLDTFSDGPNQNLSARSPVWTTDKINTADLNLTTDAVPTYVSQPTNPGNGGGVANLPTMTDCEAWAIVDTASATGSNQLWLRASNFNTAGAVAGYGITWPSTGLITFTEFGTSRLMTTATQTYSSGDGIGASILGTLILAWWQPAGDVWRVVAGCGGATFNTSGAIALRMGNSGTSSRVALFGGGAVDSTGTEHYGFRRVWAGR